MHDDLVILCGVIDKASRRVSSALLVPSSQFFFSGVWWCGAHAKLDGCAEKSHHAQPPTAHTEQTSKQQPGSNSPPNTATHAQTPKPSTDHEQAHAPLRRATPSDLMRRRAEQTKQEAKRFLSILLLDVVMAPLLPGPAQHIAAPYT